MSKIKEHWYRNWNNYLNLCLTCIVICFTAISWYNQKHTEDQYEQHVDKDIVNSTKLARYDLDLMKYKVEHIPNGTLTYEQLEFQIQSLKENLKTIREIKITSLPKNQAIDYQVYVEDLSAIIYREESGLKAMKNVSENEVDNSKIKNTIGQTPLDMNETNKETALGDISESKRLLQTDRNGIEAGRSLYELTYKKAIKILER